MPLRNRFRNTNLTCYCGRRTFSCSHGWACFTGLSACVSPPHHLHRRLHQSLPLCDTDRDCPSAPCQRGVCDTLCRLEPIPNCCTHSSECPPSPAATSVRHQTCKRSAPNTPCDDGSECTSTTCARRGLHDNPSQDDATCTQNVFVQDVADTRDDADVCTQQDTCDQGMRRGPHCMSQQNVQRRRVQTRRRLHLRTDQRSPDPDMPKHCAWAVSTRNTRKNCFGDSPCTSACYFLGICVNSPTPEAATSPARKTTTATPSEATPCTSAGTETAPT